MTDIRKLVDSMTSSRVKNPLSPKFWSRTLTAGLSLAAGASGRAMAGDSMESPNRARSLAEVGANGFAPTSALTSGPLRAIARPGLPPALGYGDTVVPLKGFNIYPPHAELCGIPDGDFDTALDNMVSESGANAIRMWGFEGMSDAGDWTSIDHAADKARDNGLSLTVVMGNQWGDCEPKDSTTGMRMFKSVDWYRSGYQDSYRTYVQNFAARYANSSAINLQLMNEALAGSLINPSYDDSNWQCLNETDSFQVLQAFTRDMVSIVRAQAPNMLISLGTRGQLVECGTSGNNYGKIAAEIDICEFHSYDEAYSVAANRMQLCFDQGKPIIMGESAALCDGEGGRNHFTDIVQAQTLVQRMQLLSQGGLAGTHLWWYRTNASIADGYSLDEEHPIHSMLRNLNDSSLTPTLESVQAFPRLMAAAVPSPSQSSYPYAPPAPPLVPTTSPSQAPRGSEWANAASWVVYPDNYNEMLCIEYTCPPLDPQGLVMGRRLRGSAPGYASDKAEIQAQYYLYQTLLPDGWIDVSVHADAPVLTGENIQFSINIKNSENPQLPEYQTVISAKAC